MKAIKGNAPQHMKADRKKHRIRFKPIISLMLSLFMVLGMMPAAIISADSTTLKSVVTYEGSNVLHRQTGTEVGEGEPVQNGEMLSTNDKFYLYYTFHITSEQVKELDPNVQYTIPMPEGFIIPDGSVGIFDLKMRGSGEIFGRLYITPKDTVYVEFDGQFLEQAAANGMSINDAYVYIGCVRDPDFPPDGEKDPNNNYKTTFDNDQWLEYGFSEDSLEEKAQLSKSGSLNADNTITWTVTYVPYKNTKKSGFEIHDKLPAPLVYDGGSTITLSNGSTCNVSYDPVTGELIFSGLDDITEAVEITYTTKVDESAWLPKYGNPNVDIGYVQNSAELWCDDNAGGKKSKLDEVNTATSGLNAGSHVWLEKTGTVTGEGDDREIQWTVTFDPAVPVDSLSLKDVMSSYMSVKGGNININGTNVSVVPNGSNEFEIPLSGVSPDADGKYVITYTTEFVEGAFEPGNSNQGQNKVNASFKYKGEEYTISKENNPIKPEPGVGDGIIEKSGSAYDPVTNTVTWHVKVNKNNETVGSVTLTDNLDKLLGGYTYGLTYVDGSIVWLSESADEFTVSPDKKTLTFKWNNLEDKTAEFTFRTKVDEAYFANFNDNVQNKILMEYVDSTGAAKTAEASASMWCSSSVFNKNAGNYDLSTNTVEWSFKVNVNKMPLKNAVIVDEIPVGLSYVEGSLKVTDDYGNTDYTANAKAPTVSGQTITIDLTDKNGNDLADGQTLTVTYKTKVNADKIPGFTDGKTGDVTVTNNAQLKADVDGQNNSAKAQASKTLRSVNNSENSNKAVSKAGEIGYYKTSDNKTVYYIDYSVKIDPYNFTMTNRILIDKYSKNLSLEKNTVKLYKATVSGNEWGAQFTKGDKITPITVEDNKENLQFTVTVPDGTGACILEYRMIMDDTSSDKFVNRIGLVSKGESFDNAEPDFNSTSSIDSGNGGGGGGGASYNGFTVTKIVQNADDTELSSIQKNVEFKFKITLKDNSGAPLTGEYSGVSFNANGEAEITLKHNESKYFSDIPVGTKYTVEEIDMPTGYSIKEGESSKREDEIESVGKTETFTNVYTKPKTGNLKITKDIKVESGSEDPPTDSKFTFNIELSDKTVNGNYSDVVFTNGVGEVTITGKGSVTIEGLPAGTNYTVTENNIPTNYKMTSSNGASGDIEADGTVTAAFTNTYNKQKPKTGNLKITKDIKVESGSEDPPTYPEFTFNIELSDKTVSGNYSGVVFTNGVGEVTITGKGSVTIEGLPAGVTATVTETSKFTYYENGKADDVTIPENDTVEVKITNTYNKPKPKTGNLKITKNIEVASGSEDPPTDSEFTFNIELSDKTVSGNYSGVVFTNGVGKVTITGKGSVTIEGLPAGVTATVTETSEFTYYENGKADDVTIPENDTVEVKITNTYNKPKPKTGNLKITKNIEVASGSENPPTDSEFTFNIELSDKTVNGNYSDVVFTNGVGEVTIKGKGSVTIEGLPAGVTATVTETSKFTYYENGKADDVTIPENDTVEVKITNTYNKPKPKPGDIKITKTVDGKNITKAELEGAIKFTVQDADGTYYDENGVPSNTKVFITLESFTLQSDGTYTLELNDIPEGTYTITETNSVVEGYSLQYDSSVLTVSATVNSSSAVPAEAALKDSYSDAAGLKITKTVDGQNITKEELEGALTFTIKTADGKYYLDKDGNLIKDEGKDEVVFTLKDFTVKPTEEIINGECKYELEIKNAPYGKYVVTETNHTITGYKFDSEASTSLNNGHPEVTAEVSAKGMNNAAEIKDVYTTGSLKLTKSFDGFNVTEEEKAGGITFTIKSGDMYLNSKGQLTKDPVLFTLDNDFDFDKETGLYVLEINNVRIGEYTITETSTAKDGYTFVGSTIAVGNEAAKDMSGSATVSVGEELTDVKIVNKYSKIPDTTPTTPSGSSSTTPSTPTTPTTPTTPAQPVEDVSSGSVIKENGELLEDVNYGFYGLISVIGIAAAAVAVLLRRRKQK